VVTHGIALSVGGTDEIDRKHLAHVKQLNRDLHARWTSEHLSFNSVEHTNLSSLVPVPFSEESVRNVVDRVKFIQNCLELPFFLENITYYMILPESEMSEIEFINAVLEEADCGLLLDVNNLYINAQNHGYDALEALHALPPERIGQIHLGGHDADQPGMIKDTHDREVHQGVWDLYRATLEHAGAVSTIIEWDTNIPAWPVLYKESERARSILSEFEGD
jgi:hypothetical protein